MFWFSCVQLYFHWQTHACFTYFGSSVFNYTSIGKHTHVSHILVLLCSTTLPFGVFKSTFFHASLCLSFLKIFLQVQVHTQTTTFNPAPLHIKGRTTLDQDSPHIYNAKLLLVGTVSLAPFRTPIRSFCHARWPVDSQHVLVLIQGTA